MRRVWKSVRQYRQDPAWRDYRRWESQEWLRKFGLPGYPFGTRGNHASHVLQGRVRGYETTLFRLAAVHDGGPHPTDVSWYSLAVLTLPGTPPAASVTVASLVRLLYTDPLPPCAGIPVHLPPHRKPGMVVCSVNHSFAKSVLTERVIHMTSGAKLGWRLHENQMTGWIDNYKPYDQLIGLAETMADIVEEFPTDVWR